MKKRNLVLGAVALLVVMVGTWGVLSRRAHSTLASFSNGTAYASPRVNVSTSTANCDPKHLKSISSDPAHGMGEPAITPHLCRIPTFTEQDVRRYMRTVPNLSGFRMIQTSSTYLITRILFITNQVANDPKGLNADTGVIDPRLIVCYVEVYGTFRVGGPPRPPGSTPVVQPLLHHALLVFDGVTGNMLEIGAK